MWYNSRPMLRRGLTVTVLALVALQLATSIAFAPICTEPCADDEDDQRCPAECVACVVCTHAQQGLTLADGTTGPGNVAQLTFHTRRRGSPPQRAADIFHVPLAA
jgi:hypothetical protein